MKVTSAFKKNRFYIYLAGELDHHEANGTVKKIEELLELNTPRDCVIDLSKLSFMDSSGIAVILKTYRIMSAMGGRLWVENAQEQPMKVLDASGIERLIGISQLK